MSLPMYKRYRGWKKKPRRRPWYLYATLLVGGLISLELLTRLAVGVGNINLDASHGETQQSERVEAYQLGFLSPTQEPYEGLPQGKLQAMRSPLMGYQLLPQQQSEFWAINPQGFRDQQPLPQAKEANEVRIFVLGGAMAFGQLSSSNQATLSDQLEALLNNQVNDQQTKPGSYQPATLPYTADEVEKVMQRPPRIPERQYRVINAAVPGYTSGNDLAMLIQQVSAYNPDLVILLNSYEDLLLPSALEGTDVPGLDALLAGEQESISQRLGRVVQDWLNQLYVVKSVQSLTQPAALIAAETIPLNLMTAVPQAALDQSLAVDEAELKARVDRYRNHLQHMVRWSSTSRKRLLVGIQPEISTRPVEQMPAAEQAILTKLGKDYTTRIQANYAQLVSAAQTVTKASANVELLDLRQLYSDSQEQVFLGPTSLTDEGYAILAAQFQQAIVDQLAIEPQPFGGG